MNSNPSEGYIRFDCQWKSGPPLPQTWLSGLIRYRQQLFAAGLIGWDQKEQVGYGNLSIRHPEDNRAFIISGTQTGGIPQIGPEHFCLVSDYHFDSNQVVCEGPLQASSESLSHAAAYSTLTEIKAVVHVHHHTLWQALLHFYPTTPVSAEYGTPEMARAIRYQISQSETLRKGLVVMAGHQDGLLSFGKDLAQATGRLIELLEIYS